MYKHVLRYLSKVQNTGARKRGGVRIKKQKTQPSLMFVFPTLLSPPSHSSRAQRCQRSRCCYPCVMRLATLVQQCSIKNKRGKKGTGENTFFYIFFLDFSVVERNKLCTSFTYLTDVHSFSHSLSLPSREITIHVASLWTAAYSRLELRVEIEWL